MKTKDQGASFAKDGTSKAWQKQDIVLTAEERDLVSMYRRMSGFDAKLVYGLSAKWATDEDARRRQSATQPRFRVIAGGRPS
jgi:hypothetical protein